MNMIMMLSMLPALCYASFFDNYTNLVTYSYVGDNCTIKPAYVNVTDTVSCLPYQNISMCCEGLIKKTNFSGPLNICYNKDGNSSFSSCYEQRLSNSESTEIGVLAVMGILFILGLVGGTLAILISCICGSNSRMFTRNGGYKSMN